MTFSVLHDAVARVLDDFEARPPTVSEHWECYDRHGRDTSYSVAVMTELGRQLERALGRPPRILDVGCGARTTAGCLVAGVQRAEYACVDKKDPVPPPTALAAAELRRACPDGWTELCRDALVAQEGGGDEQEGGAGPWPLPDAHYDLVVIDVEPHGRECEVYDRVRRYLADTHVCLLKHVGFIDLFGSACADRFLNRHIYDERRVLDYYGVAVHNRWEMRDVYVVMTRDPLPAEVPHQFPDRPATQAMVCERMDVGGSEDNGWYRTSLTHIVDRHAFGTLRRD